MIPLFKQLSSNHNSYALLWSWLQTLCVIFYIYHHNTLIIKYFGDNHVEKIWYWYNPYYFIINTCVFCEKKSSSALSSEPDAWEHEAFWLHLQQQVVHPHLHHPLPQQEGFVWREDQPESAHYLLARILWWDEAMYKPFLEVWRDIIRWCVVVIWMFWSEQICMYLSVEQLGDIANIFYEIVLLYLE